MTGTVDIVEISAILAAAGVLIGVIYYILDIRNQSRVRQTDMAMRIYANFQSVEFQKAYLKMMNLQFEDYEAFLRQYEQDIDLRSSVYSTAVFFEDIGALVKRKLISMDLVDDLISTDILRTWEKWKPYAEGLRKKRGRPQHYEWFEYLYNEMKKREQQLASKTA